MKIVRYFFVWSTLLFLCAVAFAADSSSEAVLGEARTLVSEKSYDKAITLYEGISEWLQHDQGLVIEWARAYTYANRHAEAIALFEAVRIKEPQREKEIIRELADQYKWNNQIQKAIEVFRHGQEILGDDQSLELGLAETLSWAHQYQDAFAMYDLFLKKNPDSVSALLGKAEVLSWIDRLEQADVLYGKVLKLDPGNISARNNRARIAVWQGYHRKGIALYRQILRETPGNPDALEGLAYAYHWEDLDAKALETLGILLSTHPERKGARDLALQIANAKKINVSQSNRYSLDSNQLSIFSSALRAEYPLDSFTNIGTAYEWYSFRQDGHSPVLGNRGGLNFSKHFNEWFQVHSYMYVSDYNCNGFTPFTTNTWFTYFPNDIWRFDVSYDRETFEDITSLHDKIVANSGSFSFDVRPDRFWYFSGKYKRSRISDGNNQNTALAKIEYRLHQDPYVKMYYNFYYSDFSEIRDHGYFNPRAVQSSVIGFYASRQLTQRLFIEGQVSSGYENQNPKSNHPTYFGALGINYRLSKSWIASIRGEYFNALDTNPKRVYSKKSAWASLTYSFGAEAVQVYQATQPQRPAGI